ncbi:hypothetical protein ACHQM5_016849 [Ranunculus cassubicifolius]
MANSSQNNRQTEPKKTEQIITEFFSKSLHIILDSRSPVVSSRNYSGEQFQLSPSSSSSSSSSVRPTRDKWFNLALRECPAALENLDLWRQSNLEPMVVDVVLVKRPGDFDPVCFSPKGGTVKEQFPSNWNPRHEDFMMDMKSEKIIERWIVQYEIGKKPKDSNKVSKRGGGNSSQSLYKKSIILLRSLYTTVRILPAYRLYRDLNSSGQIHSFSLAHRVSSFVEPFTRREEAEMRQFVFTPVETSCGRLCLSVMYSPAVSDVNSAPSAPMSPQFIPDYVGSRTTNPLKRFPSLPRTGLEPGGSPSSLPFARRHSWSYDGFRNSGPSVSPSPSPTYSDSHALSSKMKSHLMNLPHNAPQNPYSNSSLAHKNTSFDEYWPSPMLSPSSSPSPPTLFSDNYMSTNLIRSESTPVSIPSTKPDKNPALASNNVPPLSPSPRSTKLKPSSQTDNARALMKVGDIQTDIQAQKISSFGKDEFGTRFGGKLSSHGSSRILFSRSSGRFMSPDEFEDSDFCPFAFDDIDTMDPHIRSESFDGKGYLSQPVDPGGLLLPVRKSKSQDAAVGSLVHMLKTARPLHHQEDVSKPENPLNKNICKEGDANRNPEAGVVQNPPITSSRLLLLKTTSEALEELQSYKDMKNKLLNQASR